MEESSNSNENVFAQEGDSSNLILPVAPLVADDFLSAQSDLNRTPNKRLKLFDYILLSVCFFFSFFFIVFTDCGNFGLSWDEAYYFDPSVDAARWIFPPYLTKTDSLSQHGIEKAWAEIRELPSVVKIAVGSSVLLFGGYMDCLRAARLPSAAAFALSLVLIYLIIFQAHGRIPGVFSLLFYAFIPRIFGHAHIAAAETITVFITLLVLYCFLKGLDKPLFSILTGIAFGLALNTKINCAFLPFILLPWAHIFHRKKYVNNFFSMVFLAPVIMVITWPWLWHDTPKRLLEYFYFFVSHQYTALFYIGRKYNYGSTLAPWHYPAVMIFYTLPLFHLLFALTGIISAFRFIKKRPDTTLYLWAFVFTMLVASMPSSPKYDGVRLFLPAFAFLALLAGAAFAWIIEIFPKGRPVRGMFYVKDTVAFAGIFLICVSGLYSNIRTYPASLSYFNIFAGGIRGAEKKGMECTYWGEAVNNDVLQVLNELPRGARVKTLALHEKVFDLYQRWGSLRKDLKFNKGKAPYDYHLLLIRKGFFSRPELTLYFKWPRLKVFEKDGVPLLILFKTGPDFEKTWPYFNPGEEVKKSAGKNKK
jgi:dolichyl-phosphate-mannose-protein mannosyltransferase